MKNAVYFQSGGPTTVINSSMYGVIKSYLKNTDKIGTLFGSKYGIKGLIRDDLVVLDKPLKNYKELLKLNGALLGSARLLLKENDEKFEVILETLKKHNIGYVFVNGGNDSMDTANKLQKYCDKEGYECTIVGIPKSVDNDVYGVDHLPGYPSSCNYICEVTKGIYLDINSYDTYRINIIEILGRDSGWLAASSKLAALSGCAPDLIYVPEHPFDIERFLEDVKEKYKNHGNLLIVIADAIKDKDGKFIAPVTEVDAFGHEYFGSVGEYLGQLIKERFDYKYRCLRLGIIERSINSLNCKIDTKEAIKVGEKAVSYALKHKRGMVGIVRKDPDVYKIAYPLIPLEDVANNVRHFPKEWINKDGNDITDRFIKYAKPFIEDKYIVNKDILKK